MFMCTLKAGVLSLDVLETLRSWHPMEAEATFRKHTESLLGIQRDYTLFKCCYFQEKKNETKSVIFSVDTHSQALAV